jgi:hypothetical protein
MKWMNATEGDGRISMPPFVEHCTEFGDLAGSEGFLDHFPSLRFEVAMRLEQRPSGVRESGHHRVLDHHAAQRRERGSSALTTGLGPAAFE